MCIVKVYSLLLARGYFVDFTQYPWSSCILAYSRVQPHTALITTDQVPIYTPGWRERGTICVITLPRGANLYKVWHRTQDHYVMSRTPSPLGYRGQELYFEYQCQDNELIAPPLYVLNSKHTYTTLVAVRAIFKTVSKISSPVWRAGKRYLLQSTEHFQLVI